MNNLNALGKQLMYRNPDTAIILSNQALELLHSPALQKIHAKKKNELLALTFGSLSNYNIIKSNSSKALDYSNKSLKIYVKLNNKKGIADNNIKSR